MADFEEEARLARETVTRSASNPNAALGFLAAVVTILVLGLMWYTSSRKAPRVQNAGEESFATARLQPGMSFDKPLPKPDDNKFVIPPPAPTPPPAPVAEIPATPTPPVDDSEAKRLAELERLRKEEEAKREARLRSPMLVVNDKEGLASVDPAKVGTVEKDDDPNRRFLANAEQDVTRAHAVKYKRTDALVPQGYMIRGVLETAMQSDLPGNVRAITSEDVYSFDGRRVLIPKGTMLTGEYRSGLTRGQTRVFVVWTRMLRADGVSLMLGSYGTDSLGRSGLTGEVDNHFLQRFGSAALLTITGGVAQFVGNLGNNNATTGATYAYDPNTGNLIPISNTANQTLATARQIGAQTAAQSISQMAQEALKDEIHIPPTIYVEQGTRIIVFVKRDLDFSDLYPDPVKEALNELKHPHKRTGSQSDPALGDAPGVFSASGGAHPGLVTKP
ncbi:type IV secretion system protein VirB10 [Rhodoblastus sp.]|jgi:type IV secretion system protein VirB10|uniref:type IV secretion system protein VirB10 n=1 Tax=Rhodoblastus sp. TaxID=1962975 RepID=UPI0025D5F76B|nr:type IV secretion system protein VirB10 [Rhodoblastus sp.]